LRKIIFILKVHKDWLGSWSPVRSSWINAGWQKTRQASQRDTPLVQNGTRAKKFW